MNICKDNFSFAITQTHFHRGLLMLEMQNNVVQHVRKLSFIL